MKKGFIWWGITFIVIALLLIANTIFSSMGIDYGFTVVNIILGAALLAFTVLCAIKGPRSLIYFPIVFIFMLFEKNIATALNITDAAGVFKTDFVNNWLVILCATLLSVGTACLLGARKRKLKKYKKSTSFYNSADGTQTKSSRFESTTRYIDCTTFAKESAEVKMGSCEIFFENIDNYAGEGVLDVNVQMGSLQIHVPKEWNIVTNIDNSLGSSTIPTGSPDGKKIYINGDNHMGNLEIITE